MPGSASGKPALHSFEEAWPYYLSQHKNPLTRRRHALATAFGIAGGAIVAAAVGVGAGIAATPVIGLAAAAATLTASVAVTVKILLRSHETFEGNKSAFINKEGLKNPEQIWWGVKSDFKMSWMTLKDMVLGTNNMIREYERFGIDHTGKGAGPRPAP